MSDPTVSVVINTYNRANSLSDTLIGLGHLDYPAFEIVVVNGPSTDATKEILKEWESRIKVASCAVANLAMSRNVGIALSSGDVVAFIDDDAVPHPKWLKKLATHYADPLIGGVGGFTVDNTGVAFQCGKTLCDRFGNAHQVSQLFDERPLNRPGCPLYPSLLGTNSSFRRSVLLDIGGFDNTFAYLLDETDVCLRIVDAGYKVLYEASALVFHQYASSHIRSPKRVPRTVFPSAVSKSYFIMHHGSRHSLEGSGQQIANYREEILKSNQWLADHNIITYEHRVSLDQDLLVGLKEGTERALSAGDKTKGDLVVDSEAKEFYPFPASTRARIALISQSFPPSGQAGIARWTWMMAQGLAARGHVVHVICRADDFPFTKFENGYWVHAVKDDPASAETLVAKHHIPHHVASRAAAVRSAVAFAKSFGLDVVSFPIWDLEGIGCIEDPDLGIIMSLHTSYSLAKPYKKEWNMRPLLEHFSVNPVIAGEKRLLQSMPTILANSRAIVADLTSANGIEFSSRVVYSPHGTTDPLANKLDRRQMRDSRRQDIRLLYVGRFEQRKGFDIAAFAFTRVLSAGYDVQIDLVGDEVTPQIEAWLSSIGATSFLKNERVVVRGMVDREVLDDLYAAADVVVMPSRYESFGLVAIEAMAAGAPVIALNAGGLAEVVVDGISGCLIPLDGNEMEGVSDALVNLISDRDKCRQLGQGARRLFESKYTIDKMIDSVEVAIELAMQRKGQSHVS